jgi:hypothetical protein
MQWRTGRFVRKGSGVVSDRRSDPGNLLGLAGSCRMEVEYNQTPKATLSPTLRRTLVLCDLVRRVAVQTMMDLRLSRTGSMTPIRIRYFRPADSRRNPPAAFIVGGHGRD